MEGSPLPKITMQKALIQTIRDFENRKTVVCRGIVMHLLETERTAANIQSNPKTSKESKGNKNRFFIVFLYNGLPITCRWRCPPLATVRKIALGFFAQAFPFLG